MIPDQITKDLGDIILDYQYMAGELNTEIKSQMQEISSGRALMKASYIASNAREALFRGRQPAQTAPNPHHHHPGGFMTAHDKHGNSVRQGDLVETVYGGNHHTFVVESVSQDEFGHYHAQGCVTIEVPVTACARRKGANPADAPREGSKPKHGAGEHKTGHGEHKASRTASHDSADALEKPEVTKKSAADQSPASRKGK